jgi:hypothetical protein
VELRGQEPDVPIRSSTGRISASGWTSADDGGPIYEEGSDERGDAFNILVSADRASRERRARRSRSTRSEWSPFFGSLYRIHTPVNNSVSVGSDSSRSTKVMIRSWVTIVVAIGASLAMELMVAAGGAAAARDIPDAALRSVCVSRRDPRNKPGISCLRTMRPGKRRQEV